jgi:hypothetical protein
MYFWKVDSLVSDLKQNKVTQKEEFKYILLYGILTTLATNQYFMTDVSHNLYDDIISILSLLVLIIGTYYCYTINSKGDNKDFIVRFILIGLPIVIRLIVIFIPIIILVSIFEEMSMTDIELDNDSQDSSVYDVIIESILAIVYYWYLGKKMRDVSSTKIEQVSKSQ